jgi:hypothetical protein
MTTTQDRPLSSHHPLGASTGFLEEWRGNWDELLAEAVKISSFASELAALSEAEFAGMDDFLKERPSLPFVYLSVHGPVKELQTSEETRVEWFRALPPKVETVVLHPDTIADSHLYLELGRRLVIENMDDRKASGRLVEELAPLFTALPHAGFCLDVAHAWSVDSSMRLAHDLLDRFADRLREVHLSSLVEGRHVSLLPEHEPLFMPVLQRCTDVPWILEAEMPDRWHTRPPFDTALESREH